MRNRGFGLVEILVVIAIIAVLSAGAFYGSGMLGKGGNQPSARPDGKGSTVPGLVQLKAKDEVCRSNIGQVRLSIQANTVEDTFPASIQELKLPQEFSFCPIGKEAYVYDPTTGVAYCPHPGHEKY